MTAYPRENSGEMAAFERIMSQCERRVLRVALRLLNNPQDAQDAAQEVFLRLYKHLGSLDETRGCEPWLYRVTVNVCHDIARGRRHSLGLAEVPELPAPQPSNSARAGGNAPHRLPGPKCNGGRRCRRRGPTVRGFRAGKRQPGAERDLAPDCRRRRHRRWSRRGPSPAWPPD